MPQYVCLSECFQQFEVHEDQIHIDGIRSLCLSSKVGVTNFILSSFGEDERQDKTRQF